MTIAYEEKLKELVLELVKLSEDLDNSSPSERLVKQAIIYLAGYIEALDKSN